MVDLGLYEGAYNIYARDYSVRIEKQSAVHGFYEFGRFYPEDIGFRYKNYKEILMYDTNHYLLYWD